MRVKRGVAARAKHKKILKLSKGMQRGNRRSYRAAKQTVTKALQYSYRDRRNRKRDIRSLWITRISNACKDNGLSYSRFIGAMKKKNIELDRKILAEMSVNHKEAMSKLIKSL
jgi:large subunit ribosomal protein L20